MTNSLKLAAERFYVCNYPSPSPRKSHPHPPPPSHLPPPPLALQNRVSGEEGVKSKKTPQFLCNGKFRKSS